MCLQDILSSLHFHHSRNQLDIGHYYIRYRFLQMPTYPRHRQYILLLYQRLLSMLQCRRILQHKYMIHLYQYILWLNKLSVCSLRIRLLRKIQWDMPVSVRRHSRILLSTWHQRMCSRCLQRHRYRLHIQYTHLWFPH